MDLTLPSHKIKTFTRSLACLTRFGDELAVHASLNSFRLSTISSTRSAFCLFTFQPAFFTRFRVTGRLNGNSSDPPACQLQVPGKTLYDIFKQRTIASADRISLQIPKSDFERADSTNDNTSSGECRLTITVYHPHGVRKTYRTTYSAGPCFVALAEREACASSFTVSPRIVKDWTDHFMLGKHGTDEVTFWCTTRACKIKSFEDTVSAEAARRNSNYKDLLGGKQSISTTLSVATEEFDAYELAGDEVLITVSLKEIKALLDFAMGMGDVLNWHFDQGGQPLVVSMDSDGLEIRFVMSTNADDPAGIQREQDAKPRMALMRLPGASNAARAASQARTSATPGLARRPQSTPRGVGGNAASSDRPNHVPLFLPAEEDDEAADEEAKLWHEVDDDDDDFMVAASQAVDAAERQRTTQIAKTSTQAARDYAPPVPLDREGTESADTTMPPNINPDPDIIDMSLDDSGSEAHDALATSKENTRKRQRKNWDSGID